MKLLKIFRNFLLVLIMCASCSVKKDTFLSRNYNALKTNYNILYNGQLAYDKGLKAISEKHQDNFWKRLPIEPITFDESEIEAPKFNNVGDGFDDDAKSTPKNQTPFDRAEEKAVKAIQKHSMNIKGYEKNSKTDEAYLLLGKSRYYTQRFIPAIEAYNYIIANYPQADLNYETRVWRAKANTRLGNEVRAIETLNLLLKVLDEKEEVSVRVQEEAYTAMAIAYSETDTIQKTINNLKLATETFFNKEQSARNMFVLGQIYTELNYKDSARAVFQKLADTRRAPRKYRVHANIELAKNFEGDTTSTELLERFKKLIKNSDNRDYLDELYYQAGTLEEQNGNIKEAKDYYFKSLVSNKEGDYQKTYTYERLGNINFEEENYARASRFYDSVLQISADKFDDEKRIRRIKRKNKNLVTLREYEAVLHTNDSILNLVAMSDEEKTSFFEEYIEKIKKEDEEKRQQQLNAQNFGNQFGNSIGLGNRNEGKWYFYNSQSKSFGQSEFSRLWGNRPLEDNWRWSDKNSTEIEEVAIEETPNLRYELTTYINAIPTDEEEIKKLKDDRNNALYQLGIIYKEQFSNNSLAITKLEKLQTVNDKEEMKLPISYHLYQLYTRENNLELANQAKNFILNNHPESKFAEVIRSPNNKLSATKIAEKEDEHHRIYKDIYLLYKDFQYEKVVEQVNSFQQFVNNSELIPKLALIKALAIGKFKSKEEYQKELEFVAVSYANLEEGKKAQEIIDILNKDN